MNAQRILRYVHLLLIVALILLTGYAHAVTVPTTNQYQDIGWNYGLGTASTAVPGPGTPGMTAGQVFAAGVAALQSFVPSSGYVFDHLQFLPDVGGSGFGTTAAGITAGFDCNSGAGRCYISAIYKKTGFSNTTGYATFSINGCPSGSTYFTDGTFTGCKTTAAACPPNSTLSGGSCTCDSGYGADSTGKYCVGATCTATSNPIGGPGTAGYLFPVPAVNKAPSQKVCIGGCVAYFNGSSAQPSDAKLSGGVVQNYAYGYYQYSGLGTQDQCSVGVSGSAYKSGGVGTATIAPVSGSPTAPSNTCPTGQYAATVNGTPNCYTAAGTIVQTTAPQDTTTITNKTTQDAAGNTTVCSTSTNNQTQASTTNCSTYAPGVTPPTVPLSQTISTPGSANGGQAPTLISGSFSGSGSTTGSSSSNPTFTSEATPGQDMSAFCAANPTANACKNTPDHATYCATHTNDLDCAQLDSAPTDPTLGTLAVGTSSLTPVSLAGDTSTCPADVALPHGMSFSYGPICTFAQGLYPIIVAMAWLAAGLIVIGAKSGET